MGIDYKVDPFIVQADRADRQITGRQKDNRQTGR